MQLVLQDQDQDQGHSEGPDLSLVSVQVVFDPCLALKPQVVQRGHVSPQTYSPTACRGDPPK